MPTTIVKKDAKLKDRLGLVPESELAEMLGLKPEAMRIRRYRGEAPPGRLIGKKTFYRLEDVQKWIDQQKQV